MPMTSPDIEDRQRPATRIARPHNRSRVSNGQDVLPDVDGRSIVARRYRDISAQIISDQGGTDRMSEARLQLVRRFAAAAVVAEQMEARLANGEAIDISHHALLCSSLCRLSAKIGINRIAKDITPTLKDYLTDANQDQRTEDDAA
jgi:hypothetical protein